MYSAARKCNVAPYARCIPASGRGPRFHEWAASARKKLPTRRCARGVNSYQLTPIIASARAEIRGQNEPTLAY